MGVPIVNINGDVLWSWRKKGYPKKVAALKFASGDYYSLGGNGSHEVMAWRAPREYVNGQEVYPQGVMPCDEFEQKKLDRALVNRHPMLA